MTSATADDAHRSTPSPTLPPVAPDRTRFDVKEDISFSRFRQGLLGVVHDKATTEQRARDLEARLQEQVSVTKSTQGEASELQARLDEASRANEEALQGAAAQRKAQEDERVRHALQGRAASEKSEKQQLKLQQQGQQLYQLEEQLRARTTEVSRLRIEKDGADALIASFQSKLEEVARVIEASSASESECRTAVAAVRADQAQLQAQLAEAQQAQRVAAPRAAIERQLKASMRACEEAREREHELSAALHSYTEERASARTRHDRMAERVEATQRELGAAHAREITFDGERRALGEQVARAQAAALREREKNETLMRRLAVTDASMRVLHREVQHADANAHEAAHSARLHARASAEKLKAAEARAGSKEALERERAAELEEARCSAREHAARIVHLEEEIKSLKHVPSDTNAATPNGAAPAEKTTVAHSSASAEASPPPLTSEALRPPTPAPPPPPVLPKARADSDDGALALGAAQMTPPPPTALPMPPLSALPTANAPTSSMLPTSSASEKEVAPAFHDTAPAFRDPEPSAHMAWADEHGGAMGMATHHADDGASVHGLGESTFHAGSGWGAPSAADAYFPPPPPPPMVAHGGPDGPSARVSPPAPDPAPADSVLPPLGACIVVADGHAPPPSAPLQAERPPGSGEGTSSCAICNQALYGAQVTCKCGAVCHAACARRSSHDAHKSFTCAKCAPAGKPAAKRGAAGGGGGKKKAAKARLAAAQDQQNLLSIV